MWRIPHRIPRLSAFLATRIGWQRGQVFQQLVRCALLGTLLGGSFGATHKLNLTVTASRLQTYLNGERLVMFRSKLLDQNIRRLGAAAGLQFFLQRRLEI